MNRRKGSAFKRKKRDKNGTSKAEGNTIHTLGPWGKREKVKIKPGVNSCGDGTDRKGWLEKSLEKNWKPGGGSWGTQQVGGGRSKKGPEFRKNWRAFNST